MEKDLVNNSFNLDKQGSDKFDDSCIVVGAIDILGVDGLGEFVVKT